MPHHKSAAKRVITNEKARQRNIAARSRMRSAIKAVRDAKSGAAAKTAYVDAVAVLEFFPDVSPRFASPFGRSANPPKSVARRLHAHQLGSTIFDASPGDELHRYQQRHGLGAGERHQDLGTARYYLTMVTEPPVTHHRVPAPPPPLPPPPRE